jgi:hypothetical protein
MNPQWRDLRIEPSALDSRSLNQGKGVATGFSGGVDSFLMLADHHFDDGVPDSYRLTHLFFNNVGSHGRGGRESFLAGAERLAQVAAEIGLPFITVDSSLDAFARGPSAFQRTHTLRNLAVALLMQKLLCRYMYASSFHYGLCHIDGFDMAYADPIIVPLLVTESLDCISAGGSYTRVQRINRILSVPLSRRNLHVCLAPSSTTVPINCSRCWKCLRTQLTLEILGALDEYREVFDNEVYHERRRSHWMHVLASKEPRLVDIQRLALEHGYAGVSAGNRLWARVERGVVSALRFGWNSMPEAMRNQRAFSPLRGRDLLSGFS